MKKPIILIVAFLVIATLQLFAQAITPTPSPTLSSTPKQTPTPFPTVPPFSATPTPFVSPTLPPSPTPTSLVGVNLGAAVITAGSGQSFLMSIQQSPDGKGNWTTVIGGTIRPHSGNMYYRAIIEWPNGQATPSPIPSVPAKATKKVL